METSFIITFIGDDRPGLVDELARVISENNGSWQESRSSQLAGKFTGLILVRLPTESATVLQEQLKGLNSSGLSVRVTPTGDVGVTPSGKVVVLHLIGPDRPGIVREVSSELSARKINVEEMHTGVSPAPMSAEKLFEARIEARLEPGQDMDELVDRLDEIANQMTLDISFEDSV